MEVQLVIAYFILTLLNSGNAGRTHQKIYVQLRGITGCFRRFNGTHQIGCSSDRGGNVGVLHYVNNTDSDIDWIVKKGPHSPYIPLMKDADFTEENLNKLTSVPGRVRGIIVISGDPPPQFSPDKKCPNDGFGMYSEDSSLAHCHNTTWNPEGNHLMYRDWDFPIQLLTNEDNATALIENCYKKFNQPVNGRPRSYPLCNVEIKFPMDGAKDSETCIRRSRMQINLMTVTYCDPIGSNNVYAFVRPVNKTTPVANRSVIVASTRLDSYSMFDGKSPGAESSLSGVVTLLAVAEAFGNLSEELSGPHIKKNILFTFLNGEAFDYIGSGRMVYDIEHGRFPVSGIPANKDGPHTVLPQHLDAFYELSQVGLLDQGKLWIHSDPISQKEFSIKQEVRQMSEELENIAASETNISLKQTKDGQPLPPASLQQFLKKFRIPGIVITDHQKGFKNKYYNGRFDLPEFINASYPDGLPANETSDYITPAAVHLHGVATVLAKALYRRVTEQNDTARISVNLKTVNNLLYCFLHRVNCSLIQQVVSPNQLSSLVPHPVQTYVSVMYGSHLLPSLTRRLLASFIGERINTTEKECKAPSDSQMYNYFWVNGRLIENQGRQERDAHCIRTTANYSVALSPAFEMDDYNWASKEHPTWTESRWGNDALSLRFFLVPSLTRQLLTLFGGLILLVVSLVVVHLFNSRAGMIFKHTQIQSDS